MDETTTVSKEQRRTSLLLTIALFVLIITNFLFAFREKWRFSTFVPIFAAACGVSVVLTILALISLIRNYGKLSKKKRSVISCVGLFVLCGMEISLCVSAVTRLNARRNAENSAVLFIKDKYGIDAEAVYRGSYPGYNGGKLTTVDMTANGKKFRLSGTQTPTAIQYSPTIISMTR